VVKKWLLAVVICELEDKQITLDVTEHRGDGQRAPLWASWQGKANQVLPFPQDGFPEENGKNKELSAAAQRQHPDFPADFPAEQPGQRLAPPCPREGPSSLSFRKSFLSKALSAGMFNFPI